MNLHELSIETIEAIMDALPVDISFVDAEDRVKFFNTPHHGRIFPRTKMDLQRKVQNCHPPKSLSLVEKILTGFKEGSREEARFWIDLHGRKILIEYSPVRDAHGTYLGTLEVTRDITDIQNLQGEKRLLDEQNLR
ncbi:MAG: PAS domain-containing protein [Brevinematales bacterium]|nr:PAS domain-containing protein [Brevinematales bacterium]